MKPTLTLRDTEAMVDRAYSAAAHLAAETAAWEAARTPGDIRRALSHRTEVPGKSAGPGPWVALTGYALGLLALVGGLAWAVERLPGGWREKAAVGVGVGLCWVVGRGKRC